MKLVFTWQFEHSYGQTDFSLDHLQPPARSHRWPTGIIASFSGTEGVDVRYKTELQLISVRRSLDWGALRSQRQSRFLKTYASSIPS